MTAVRRASSAAAASVEAAPTSAPATAPATVPATARRARAKKTTAVLGIDIGGSGIKAAPVDLHTGLLLADRIRIPTPSPSRPADVAQIVKELVDSFDTAGTVGVTFPGVVTGGVTRTAANMDHKWVNLDAHHLFEHAVGRPFCVINDAQAAIMAEMRYGAGRGEHGLVLMLTFGTGIGSGLAYKGVTLPGIEFGHISVDGDDAEKEASASARERNDWSWKQWAKRVNRYLHHVETMMWPDLIIVGGGVSERADKFLPLLKTRARLAPAQLTNEAGIVGAAIEAHS